jgi:hypothetical protein
MKPAEFFAEHGGYISRGDIEGLMRDHYHDDAEMVTFDFNLKGKEAIKNSLMKDSPAKMGKVLGMNVAHLAGSDDVVIFTAEITSEKLGTFVARDAFYVVNGKIKRHIALTLPPEKDSELRMAPLR